MSFFESLEGKDHSEQLSTEFHSQEQILCRDSCCLVTIVIAWLHWQVKLEWIEDVL